jgi:dsDNA-binding SOS-regulon protein
MAVETRYVVIRKDKAGEELEMKTFTDKRSADNYDKMLDMADAVYSLLESSPISLSESDREELSVFLAEQREETLVALQAKKAPSAPKKKKASKQADLLNDDEQDISPASLSETLLTEKNSKSASDSSDSENNLVDFVIEKDDAA